MTGSLSQSYRKADRCSPFIKPSLRGREGNSFIILIIISSICELYRILGFIVTFFLHAYSVTGSNGHFLCSLLDPLFSPRPCPDLLAWNENLTVKCGGGRVTHYLEPTEVDVSESLASYRSIAPWETHFLGQSRLSWAQTPSPIIVASYLLTWERGR